jgi:hypothetical protein
LSVSFTPLKALDPTLVSQLKETLPASLFDQLNGSLSIDQDRLKFAEYKNRVLEERLRLLRIEKYGPGSEKLSDAQLELLELEPGVSSAEVEAESETGAIKTTAQDGAQTSGPPGTTSGSAKGRTAPSGTYKSSSTTYKRREEFSHGLSRFRNA